MKGETIMTTNLKKDLQAVNNGLKALENKIEKMIIAIGKVEKPKAAPAKPAKKKVAIKKPTAKKSPGKVTAADTVLAIIKRRKKGVGVAALMEKTGFNQKKVANIVFKLRKLGQIKSVGRGVYVKV
jgi:hypothetical protein